MPARPGHRPVDVVVAAIGERHDHGVLDYDVIRAPTDLRFESVWLAQRGVL